MSKTDEAWGRRESAGSALGGIVLVLAISYFHRHQSLTLIEYAQRGAGNDGIIGTLRARTDRIAQ